MANCKNISDAGDCNAERSLLDQLNQLVTMGEITARDREILLQCADNHMNVRINNVAVPGANGRIERVVEITVTKSILRMSIAVKG